MRLISGPPAHLALTETELTTEQTTRGVRHVGQEASHAGLRAHVEPTVHSEKKLAIRVQLRGELGRELVEADKFVNLIALRSVPRAGCIKTCEELCDVAEDGGIQTSSSHLAPDKRSVKSSQVQFAREAGVNV